MSSDQITVPEEIPEPDRDALQDAVTLLLESEEVIDVHFDVAESQVLVRAEYTGTTDDYRLRLMDGDSPASDVYDVYEAGGIDRPTDDPTIGVQIEDDRVYFENDYQLSN